ncbi:MAG: fumarate hydratase C-terminal domain-containing protein [Candidatus Omnitrophica bacterium]|nr:fumarate hydratase C-terminal domain-containing protein [Candidatus Omnitrophota bacterium]
MKYINLPLTKDIRKSLKPGEELLLTGKIYTARDQAHKRFCESLKKGERLPISLKDNVIFYCGPAPTRPGDAIGSCGPTTSSRMDTFTPQLLSKGLAAMIGKGRRSERVKSAIKRHGAVYLIAIGGAGAYLARRVKKARPIAYKDLGTEAIHELWVEDFPVIVAIDSKGKSIFKRGGKDA